MIALLWAILMAEMAITTVWILILIRGSMKVDHHEEVKKRKAFPIDLLNIAQVQIKTPRYPDTMWCVKEAERIVNEHLNRIQDLKIHRHLGLTPRDWTNKKF